MSPALEEGLFQRRGQEEGPYGEHASTRGWGTHSFGELLRARRGLEPEEPQKATAQRGPPSRNYGPRWMNGAQARSTAGEVRVAAVGSVVCPRPAQLSCQHHPRAAPGRQAVRGPGWPGKQPVEESASRMGDEWVGGNVQVETEPYGDLRSPPPRALERKCLSACVYRPWGNLTSSYCSEGTGEGELGWGRGSASRVSPSIWSACVNFP